MPTYEFRCPNGHGFDRFYRKISDAAAELPCPECGAVATRQLSAGAGLLFKGSGFYLTDYGKNAHRKTRPAADGASKSTERQADGGASAAPDSKPAEDKPATASATAAGDKAKPAPKSGGGSDKS
jgi:putative FmdB family regulatory protein